MDAHITAALDRIDTLVGTGPDMATKVVFGGGGRGQMARVTLPDGSTVIGSGTTRLAALGSLLETLRAQQPATADDRPTVDQAVEALRAIFPGFGLVEEDSGRTPGPKWVDINGVATLTQIIPCVGECMAGRSSICECRCRGENHGIGNPAFLAMMMGDPSWASLQQAQAVVAPTMIGPKECLCGCGGTTQRRFVPGHDARYHAAQKRIVAEALASARKAAE